MGAAGDADAPFVCSLISEHLLLFQWLDFRNFSFVSCRNKHTPGMDLPLH